MDITIYALTDGDKLFYVGKTNKPARRKSEHICESLRVANKNPVKELFIRKAINNGKQITMIEIEKCGHDWQTVERFWINMFDQLGHNLTNLAEM